MSDPRRAGPTIPPFPPGTRSSGVLLHVTSLPGPHGIGDLGPAAFAWMDRLVAAGQTWWQVLPLGPTGYAHSPYQALSSFAGNTALVSPDGLVEDGLLRADDAAGGPFPADHVDYDAVLPFKERLLERSWRNFRAGARPDLREPFERFCRERAARLDDVALFLALKAKHGQSPYWDWPAELVRREPRALEAARKELAGNLDRIRFDQFTIFRQWELLREHARRRGLKMMGDLPFFVSPDSADVWANPGLFQLDERSRPRAVAGVPPDYFSEEGQLWGNPVYDWDALRRAGYRWWVLRFKAVLNHLDAVRLDHFRAVEAAWHVPAGAATAREGAWVPGPGAEFLDKVREALGGLPVLAEDLGTITPAVEALRDQFNLPGMRVLQFAFDGNPDNPHLPRRHVQNVVAYTGTHDNDTTRGWYESLGDESRRIFWRCLERREGRAEEVAPALVKLAWDSPAALAVAPLQDLLNLGTAARMNVPGRAEGNWRWRLADLGLADVAFSELEVRTREAGRWPHP